MFKFLLSAGLVLAVLLVAVCPAQAGIMGNLTVINPNPYPVTIILGFNGGTPARKNESFVVPAGRSVTYHVHSQKGVGVYILAYKTGTSARVPTGISSAMDPAFHDFPNYILRLPRY
jgi:hypothetical protein